MKLARKLTLAVALGVLAVLAVQAYFQVRRDIRFFERDIQGDNHLIGRAVAAAAARTWRGEGAPAALQLVEEANERESQVDIRFVWLDSKSADRAPLVDRAALAPVARGESIVLRTEQTSTRPAHLITYVPVAISGRIAAIELAESLAGETAFVRATVTNTLVGTGAVALVCAAVTTALGIWFVGRPMRRLMDQARRIGSGDLSHRIALRQNDEIGAFAREMNAMCDRLVEANARAKAEADARQLAQEQLRHADRLATVGTLASGIAHELGTPLQVVTGYARMMAQDELGPEDVPKSGRAILEHGERMAKIIRHLLDFARRRGAVKTRTDLLELARAAASLVAPLAVKRGVRIEWADAEAAVVTDVDAEQVRQALTNLIVNAVQAMPEGGNLYLAVTTGEARPPADHGGPTARYARVVVEDEGHGMSGATMSHVFEPFFTTKPVGEGTGLGLSIAHGIVSEHGGWIAVESREGEGSRFTVHFPLESSP